MEKEGELKIEKLSHGHTNTESKHATGEWKLLLSAHTQGKQQPIYYIMGLIPAEVYEGTSSSCTAISEPFNFIVKI